MAMDLFASKRKTKITSESVKQPLRLLTCARECCATWCSFKNIMFFKTTDQMMLDVGGVYSRREVLQVASTYGMFRHVFSILA